MFKKNRLLVVASIIGLVSFVQAIRAQSDGPVPPTIYAIFATGSTIFAGTDSVVYSSTNNGSSWTAATAGLPNQSVSCFAASGNAVFAGINGNGIYKSVNNGASWTAANAGLSDLNVLSLAAIGNYLFAGCDSLIYRSADNGTTWAAVDSSFSVGTVRRFTAIGNDLFAASYGGGVYKSTNNGTGWAVADSGLTNQNVSSLAVIGSTLFAGTMYGVFASADSGATWTTSSNLTGLTNVYTSSLASNGNDLFVGTIGGGIFLSTDKGAHWNAVDSGLSNVNIKCLAAAGGTIFAGTGSGVFVSTDNGTTWTAANAGFFSGVGRASFQPSNPAFFRIVPPGAGGSRAYIAFSLVRRERVTVTVCDLLGHPVQSLADNQFGPGPQTLFWDARPLSSGCFLVKMKSETAVYVKKIALAR